MGNTLSEKLHSQEWQSSRVGPPGSICGAGRAKEQPTLAGGQMQKGGVHLDGFPAVTLSLGPRTDLATLPPAPARGQFLGGPV